MIFFTQAAVLPYELDKDRLPVRRTQAAAAIINARILTITRGEIPNGTIVIRGGKIVAVGEKVAVPADAEIIDAKGKIVTPGLVDAHTHLATDSTNEGAEAITPEVRIQDVLNPQSLGLYQKLAVGNTVSLALHGSANPIGGESLVIKHRYRARAEELLIPGAPRLVKFALGENVTRANSTSASTRFPGTRMGVEATYRRAFTEARNYLQAWEAFEKGQRPRPRKDLRLDALADMLRGKIWIHAHGYRQDELLMLVRLSKEFGLKLVALQHALEAYKIAPELAAAGVGASIFVDHWNFKIEAADAIPYAGAILTQAGVLTSVHTDTGGGMTPFNLEAAKCIRYGGVSELDALKMITINPAKQLGIDARVGSIEVGKDADLAIWNGHPLSVYSNCAMTFVNGDLVYKRRDAFGLDAKAVASKNPPTPATSISSKLVPSVIGLYAIVGGTIHTEDAEIANGTLVVREGKIVAVGKQVPVPRAATIVDAKGAHIYPGFIDGGSEIGLVEYPSTAATEDARELGQYQPDLVAANAVNPESPKIAVGRHGGVTTVVARPDGPIIAGQSSAMHLDGSTTEQMTVSAKTALHVRYPESIRGEESDSSSALDELEEQFRRARRYAEARKADPARTPADPRWEALVPYARGERPVVFAVNSSAGIRGAVAFGKRLNLRTVIEGGKEAWKVTELLAKETVPVLIPLPSWSSPGASGQLQPLRDYDPVDATLSLPALLERAGVSFGFQSDTGENVSNLPFRAGYACAYGLSRRAAIRALTTGPADALGLGDRLGRLKAGYSADIIVVDGDPLEIVSRVRHMFVAGRLTSPESKWTQLAMKFAGRLPQRKK